MWKLIGAVPILVLAVLHAPRPAQALLSEYFPSTFFDLGASEPVMLLLTGIALLGLSRVAAARSPVSRAEAVRAVPRPPRAAPRSAAVVSSARRAA